MRFMGMNQQTFLGKLNYHNKKKIKRFLLKCTSDCFLENQNIVRFVTRIDNNCSLCELETASNCFIYCQVAKRLWLALGSNVAGILASLQLQD